MYAGHRDQRWGPTTYAQHGDDLMLVNIFELIGVEKPSFIEVGGWHPIDISNTYLLYRRGSRGIIVEPNPNLIEAFHRERPEDKILEMGVSTHHGEMNFYMYDNRSGRNTFSLKETRSLTTIMAVRDNITLPVVTLNWIIETHCGGQFPDLLSMDIEGLDYDVLDSVSFKKSRPKIVIVETRRNESQRMVSMMNDKDFFLYCRMGENLIFVHTNYLGILG